MHDTHGFALHLEADASSMDAGPASEAEEVHAVRRVQRGGPRRRVDVVGLGALRRKLKVGAVAVKVVGARQLVRLMGSKNR